MWKYTGRERPPFAEQPGPGQESVWDFPRPPALEHTPREVEVRASGLALARSRRALRILETASPPTYYVPGDDVATGELIPAAGSSFCEWKGMASYWALPSAPDVAIGWSYPAPSARFARLEGCFSFYPARVECRVDGERVEPQPGGFYGGWVTPDLVGPWKGEPGTGHW
ncbi:MAG: DUF427 domain-containing protein [Acidobacteriota bacterium]